MASTMWLVQGDAAVAYEAWRDAAAAWLDANADLVEHVLRDALADARRVDADRAAELRHLRRVAATRAPRVPTSELRALLAETQECVEDNGGARLSQLPVCPRASAASPPLRGFCTDAGDSTSEED